MKIMDSGVHSNAGFDQSVSLVIWSSRLKIEGSVVFDLMSYHADCGGGCRITVNTGSSRIEREKSVSDECVHRFVEDCNAGRRARFFDDEYFFSMSLVPFDSRFYELDMRWRLLAIGWTGDWFGSVADFKLSSYMVERKCVDSMVRFWREIRAWACARPASEIDPRANP